MTAVIFRHKEQEYQEWLTEHPAGYVLTTHSVPSPNYMSLHRSSCRMIKSYMKNMAPDAFTGQNYQKICAATQVELLTWILKHDGEGFTNRCKICAPDDEHGLLDELDVYHIQLESAVQKSALDGDYARKARLAAAPKKPESQRVTTTVYKRNPDVIAEVLWRAQGVCEMCFSAAPFISASKGTPYLEVHHRVPLAEDGDDTVENAIALCPNCHRKEHFGVKASIE